MQTSREEEDEKPRSNAKQQSSPHTDSETAAARTDGQKDRRMDGRMDGWMAFLCSVIMSGVCHHSSSLQEHGLDNLHT